MDLAEILLMVGCLFPNTASHIFVAIMPVVQPRGDHASGPAKGWSCQGFQPRGDHASGPAKGWLEYVWG